MTGRADRGNDPNAVLTGAGPHSPSNTLFVSLAD